ncbi:triphosphoribosyl-dephospho-CoA synthase [Spiroplasma endosymbiont of Stenodema calcarata]|uniref:triphosphoribosyl-dephospho-CoA synthase n=1 Tax=Spiroplasma endosymbiont of Stenodema calcarata TaxID=3139328 RepID=UPI003CCAFA36
MLINLMPSLKKNKHYQFCDQQWDKLIAYGIECIITEANSYPSFGLVSKKDSGCHQDMNIKTFIKSSATFKFYFRDIINLVTNNSELDFASLRKLGCHQEARMLSATKNINTHKGLIFAFGIIFYITCYGLYYKIPFTKWSSLIKKMTISLKKDFENFNGKTYGEKLYQLYNITGARGLAIDGYQIVFEEGLTFLKYYQKVYPQLSNEDYSLLLLVFYLSRINDTTLIVKVGYEQSKEIANKAKEWIEILASKGWQNFYQIVLEHNLKYQQQKISPGGCADLCVITLFLAQFTEF